jgi:hypothetical protein
LTRSFSTHSRRTKIPSLGPDSAIKKTFDTTQEKIFNIVQSSYGFLNNTLEIKAHHQRQLQKFLMTKVKNLQQENEDLKKKRQKLFRLMKSKTTL